jgi:hypothetical protein
MKRRTCLVPTIFDVLPVKTALILASLLFVAGCGNSAGTLPALQLQHTSGTDPIVGHPFPITHAPPLTPGGGGRGPTP